MHESILGAKTEIISQYGNDSYAVELIGLRRKSARRRPLAVAARL
jgi:hypothetical protein